MNTAVQSLLIRSNDYLKDYADQKELRFAVSGGELYISAASGAYLGKVSLTQIH